MAGRKEQTMGKIYWREFVDTFVGHGVYKTGLNHGADITSASEFEQDMVELEELDPEFAEKVRTFMKSIRPLVPGHYGTDGYTGPHRVWWEIEPVWSPSHKWLGDPQHERKFARYRAA